MQEYFEEVDLPTSIQEVLGIDAALKTPLKKVKDVESDVPNTSIHVKSDPYVNNQDNELNILVCLLQEYTQKKIKNSNTLIRLYYQIFLLVFLFFSSSALLYYFRLYIFGIDSFRNDSSYGPPVIVIILSSTLVYMTVMMIDRFCRSIISIGIKSQSYFDWTMLFIVVISIFITILITPLYLRLPANIITLLIFATHKKIINAYRNKKIIDFNLSKIIRTTSQAREHVYSGFGKKVELDVRLKEAENALQF